MTTYEMILPAHGKLAALLPRLGSVSKTLVPEPELVMRGLGLPIGSLSQCPQFRSYTCAHTLPNMRARY